MRRYFFDEEGEEFQDEADYMFEFEDDEPYIKNDILGVLQLDAIEQDLNIRLLSVAIKLAEKTFGWRFMPLKRKIRIIKEAYSELNEIVIIKEDESLLKGKEDDPTV